MLPGLHQNPAGLSSYHRLLLGNNLLQQGIINGLRHEAQLAAQGTAPGGNSSAGSHVGSLLMKTRNPEPPSFNAAS